MRIPNLQFALVCLVFTTLVLGKPGASKSIWGGWTGMGDITSMNGKIYVTNSGTLYETMTDGKYQEFGGSWASIGGMAAAGEKLYNFSAGTLYETETK